MAGMTKAQMTDELEAMRSDLQEARGDLDFRRQAYLPAHDGHIGMVDRCLERIARMLGDEDGSEDADDGADDDTTVATVPPSSAGGAAADPVTGATTNVPFSAPVADGDTSSIPGAPDYDPAAQSEVERDAARRQHAAERIDSGGGTADDAAKAAGTASEDEPKARGAHRSK
jgi:hypothetical protein